MQPDRTELLTITDCNRLRTVQPISIQPFDGGTTGANLATTDFIFLTTFALKL